MLCSHYRLEVPKAVLEIPEIPVMGGQKDAERKRILSDALAVAAHLELRMDEQMEKIKDVQLENPIDRQELADRLKDIHVSIRKAEPEKITGTAMFNMAVKRLLKILHRIPEEQQAWKEFVADAAVSPELDTLRKCMERAIRAVDIPEPPKEFRPEEKIQDKEEPEYINESQWKKPVPSKEIRRTQDFGKKIGGARKEIWKDRGLAPEDIEGMTDAEAVKYITKDNIWKKPDYQEMISSGHHVRAVYFIKQVRNALPAKVSYSNLDTTPELVKKRQEEFISLIRDVKERLLNVKSDQDICRFYDEFADAGIYITRTTSYFVKRTEKGYAVNNRLLKAMIVSPAGLHILDRRIAKEQFGIDAEEKLPKDLIIKYLTQQQEYVVLKRGCILAEGLKSEKEAVEKAKELGKEGAAVRKKKFIPQQLEYIRRDGPSNGITESHPADGNMYMDTFGFAGGEFGNWMSEKDRQISLNMGYDAFSDLAYVLGMDPSDTAFDGHLSVAFGARGHGRACAHYEPEREVINLTKMKGAGSLAHEWGHAFDDIIGKKLGLTGFMTKYIQDERVPDSMKELVEAMKRRPPEGNGKYPEETDFYKNSVKMDRMYSKEDKGYWHSTEEMFARAFACYVHDRLQWRSDYLCGHSESDLMMDFSKEPARVVYGIPKGAERDRINRCFDKVFAECRELGLLKAANRDYREVKEQAEMIVRRKGKGR